MVRRFSKIDLDAGESQIWYILADVGSDAPLGIYTNTATVNSDTPDSDESNNTSSCNTDIKGEADIRIVKTLITAPLRMLLQVVKLSFCLVIIMMVLAM